MQTDNAEINPTLVIKGKIALEFFNNAILLLINPSTLQTWSHYLMFSLKKPLTLIIRVWQKDLPPGSQELKIYVESSRVKKGPKNLTFLIPRTKFGIHLIMSRNSSVYLSN